MANVKMTTLQFLSLSNGMGLCTFVESRLIVMDECPKEKGKHAKALSIGWSGAFAYLLENGFIVIEDK